MQSGEFVCNAGEFFWSLSRHNLFNFCKRAYFYKYYASVGGWEENISEKVRILYTLKKCHSINVLPEIIFSQAVQNVFPMKLETNCFQYTQKANQIFEKELFRVYSAYMKTIYDWDIPDLIPNCKELRENTKLRLTTGYRNFVNSSLFAFLVRIKSIEWQRLKLPLKIMIANFPVLISPHLIFIRKNICNIVDFSFSKINNTSDAGFREKLYPRSVINSIIIEKYFNQPFTNIHHIDYFCISDKCRIMNKSEMPSFEYVYNSILSSAGEMLQYISSQGKAYESAFPLRRECVEKKNSSVSFASCIFRNYCNLYG